MSALLGQAGLLERLAAVTRAAQAAGASDAEVSYFGRALGMTRFAGSVFTQAGVVIERRIRVRVAVGARIGAVTTGLVDESALADAAAQAVAIAREHPPRPEPLAFARPAEARSPLATARFSAATAEASPALRAEACGRMFARAAKDGLVCAGALVTGPVEVAVATSAGVALYQRHTEAKLELIAGDAVASGYGAFCGPDLAALDPIGVADEACATAVRGRALVPPPAPGPLDVVLAPAAVAEALEWMAATSFSGRALVEGTSLLGGRQGTRVTGAEVTIRDDVGHDHPQAMPIAFDAEGVVKQAVPFIEAGVAGAVVTDRETARKLGQPASTGHAAGIMDDFADGPIAAHLVMTGGDADAAALLARVERGLYVTRFHYVNGLVDTRRATMTGMTRDGTFMIEAGRLGRAVPNLRWTESLLDALGRLGGMGRDLACFPARWTATGTVLCPALLVRGFRFTGRSG